MRLRRKSPPQERICSAPGRHPEKHHEDRSFPKFKERMLGCWGVPEAGIRARIMSISRALGAEKPAAKRPRSYMEGPRGRKLSIMSTVLPNTPSQKKLGGYVKQNTGAHHEHQQGLGGRKTQPPNALEATWKDPVAEKQAEKVEENVYGRMLPVAASHKNRRGRARPLFLPGGALCACGILSIYLYLLIYPSIICIYNIYIYISLSFFEQVKLLERA